MRSLIPRTTCHGHFGDLFRSLKLVPREMGRVGSEVGRDERTADLVRYL